MNPVDLYLDNAQKWLRELAELRRILLDSQLEESWKWKKPCYSYEGNNISIIGELKDACILSFFKGVLLQDHYQILIQPGENSQSARILRFQSVEEIISLESTLKEYIQEAIELEKQGRKVQRQDNTQLEIIAELQEQFQKSPALKIAFEALTPGRQRAYLIFFEAAKQSATRHARIEKYKQRILDGIGFNDCVCGHTKKPPGCDGSHKYF